MIKVIAQIKSSKRDINGNTYHFAVFYNPQKDRHHSVVVDNLGSASNGEHLAYTLSGGDWEKTLVFTSVLPIKQWNRENKWATDLPMDNYKNIYYGSKGNTQALHDLYDIVPEKR